MASRLRVAKGFKRTAASEEIEPKATYWLVFEGTKTEVAYFLGIENNQKSIGLNQLVRLKSLERDINDMSSHPLHVLKGAQEAIAEGTINLEGEDKVVLIFDRDCGSFFPKQYENVMKTAKKEGYLVGISNPTFEFWLLLHEENVSKKYDLDKIYANEKKGKYRYLETLLYESHNFKKTKLNFEIYKEKVLTAVEQSESFETDIDKLIDNLGSSVGKIIKLLI